MNAASLRARLTLVILPPLVAIAAAAGVWQLSNARATAVEVHDRRLLLTALAVQYDVLLSSGEALAPTTRDLLSGARGGPIFYHVYAPDGAIVTGYATPPVGIPRAGDAAAPTWFAATYLGRPVHGVRLRNQGEIDGIAGRITTTVWQDASARTALVWTLMGRTLAVIGALIGSVGLVVWFGVRRGLRPLADLEAAIARRSGDDLSDIRRAVPVEVAGIVDRLNGLFGQVRRVMAAQTTFIADAAHQLRNPVAGVLSLAEAVRSAPEPARARRLDLLIDAARDMASLTEDLLILERATAGALRLETVDAAALLGARLDAFVPPDGVEVVRDLGGAGRLRCDPMLIGEAVSNLLDNARRHGGPGLSRIVVVAAREDGALRIRVADDGRGVPPEAAGHLLDRFSQLEPGRGSGLGLPIAAAAAAAHGGRIEVAAGDGLSVTLRLPAPAGP